MGEDASRRKTEVDALSLGLDLGMNLIDTAEMYAEGGAEEVVGAPLPAELPVRPRDTELPFGSGQRLSTPAP